MFSAPAWQCTTLARMRARIFVHEMAERSSDSVSRAGSSQQMLYSLQLAPIFALYNIIYNYKAKIGGILYRRFSLYIFIIISLPRDWPLPLTSVTLAGQPLRPPSSITRGSLSARGYQIRYRGGARPEVYMYIRTYTYLDTA